MYIDELSYVDIDTQEEVRYYSEGTNPATPATEDELAKDATGFTNPNLHRRVDPQDPKEAADVLDQEVGPRDYKLTVSKLHSYRTTHINTHDEESEISEIP